MFFQRRFFSKAWLLTAVFLLEPALFHQRANAASTENPEDFRIEITPSAWLVDSSGTIQANGTPVDLVSDLGAKQQKPTFFGTLVLKPGRRHRIVLEGMPLSLSGFNIVNRTIVYRGQTFTVNQTLRSSAEFNYLFGGYQYDLLIGPRGHLGLSIGGAYIQTSGTITA